MFLFVPLDEIREIWGLKSLVIPATGDHANKYLSCFDTSYIEDLAKRFGDGFAAQRAKPMLHQGVFLMEVMKLFYRREVLYMNVDQLTTTFRQHSARHVLLSSRPLVVFLYQTTYDLNWTWVDQLFNELIVLLHDKPLRTYPRRTELVWETRKLGDIQVLDDIAQLAKEERFQYRPKTCSGSGPCALVGHPRTTQKRSNSCGSRNVRTISCRTKQLRCQAPGGVPATKQQAIGTVV